MTISARVNKRTRPPNNGATNPEGCWPAHLVMVLSQALTGRVQVSNQNENNYVVSEVIRRPYQLRSEEHTSELQSLMRISYAVFCLTKKKQKQNVLNHYD